MERAKTSHSVGSFFMSHSPIYWCLQSVILLSFVLGCSAAPVVSSQSSPSAKSAKSSIKKRNWLAELCIRDFKKTGKSKIQDIRRACKQVRQLKGCVSQKGIPIYHMDKFSLDSTRKRILTFALVHGDEGPSATVARIWMERLSKINPRNHWRVIPILNPDGWRMNTRMNANGVDLNRNFPTKNWKVQAMRRWKSKKFDPRRYPGKRAASEIETRCAMKHVTDFKPSFIIAIHTPYGVLDFDGPKMKFPTFSPLPWISLGNYPGSMGRYMWKERKVPVLTIELKGNRAAKRLEQFDRLQDISGLVAIQSEKILRKTKKYRKHGPKRK